MADLKKNTPKPMVVGANHGSSAMSIRDRLFVEDAQVPGVLEKLREAGIGEAMVVSTCDRVEIQGLHEDPDAAARRIDQDNSGIERMQFGLGDIGEAHIETAIEQGKRIPLEHQIGVDQ